ncbi:hypothetical protein JQC92_04570 [Shewanella sp. 202IG2-18]|uniref:hypothetical protein n=1 Tax=Parashewanella hymeniacidonis TaxID=2807618 RepID=UPI0019603E1B|nr:hypothetical protein [Parashewanella hymeniacidonis]MBM7071316.1 hypothetical protein [Parashewanella hymeniacidonis]
MATTLIQCNHLATGFTDTGQLQSVSQYIKHQKQQKAHLPTLMLYIHRNSEIFPVEYTVVWHTLHGPNNLTRTFAQLELYNQTSIENSTLLQSVESDFMRKCNWYLLASSAFEPLLKFIDSQTTKTRGKIERTKSLAVLSTKFDLGSFPSRKLARSRSLNDLPAEAIDDQKWAQFRTQQDYFVAHKSSSNPTLSEIRIQLQKAEELKVEFISQLLAEGIDLNDRDAVKTFLDNKANARNIRSQSTSESVPESVKDDLEEFVVITAPPQVSGNLSNDDFELTGLLLAQSTQENEHITWLQLPSDQSDAFLDDCLVITHDSTPETGVECFGTLPESAPSFALTEHDETASIAQPHSFDRTNELKASYVSLVQMDDFTLIPTSACLGDIDIVEPLQPKLHSPETKIIEYFKANKIHHLQPLKMNPQFEITKGSDFVSASQIESYQRSYVSPTFDTVPISQTRKKFQAFTGTIKRHLDKQLLNSGRKNIGQGRVYDCYVALQNFSSAHQLEKHNIDIHRELSLESSELASSLLAHHSSFTQQANLRMMFIPVGVHAKTLALIESHHAILCVFIKERIFVIDSKNKFASLFNKVPKITYICTQLQPLTNSVDCTRFVTFTAMHLLNCLLKESPDETSDETTTIMQILAHIPQPEEMEEAPKDAEHDEGEIQDFCEL